MHISIIEILAPIFTIIILGYLLRRNNFPGENFWQPAEQITYYILFPALLIHKISIAPLLTEGFSRLIIAAIIAVLAISLFLLICRPLFKAQGPSFSSLFQGTVRFNTYIGLSIILPLYGPTGILTAGVLIAALIPLVNILSVSILLHYGQNNYSHISALKIFNITARNPIVLACLFGILLNLTQSAPPVPISLFLKILGQAALPLGLLTVGSSLRFAAIKESTYQIFLASIFKLALMPCFMWISCRLFSVRTDHLIIAMIFAALPGSALSFILSKQLGGDSELMANIITVQTCGALFTLPLFLSFFILP